MTQPRFQRSVDGVSGSTSVRKRPTAATKPVHIEKKTASAIPVARQNEKQGKKGSEVRKLWFAAPLFILVVMAVVSLGLVVAAVVGGVIKYRQLSVQTTPAQVTNRDLATLARQQQQQGDLEGAVKSLSQIIEGDPENADATAQLALTHYRLKEYAEAISVYEKLTPNSTQGAFAWNGIGNTYRDWAGIDSANSGAYVGKAIHAYLEAIRTNPAYVAAYSNLALLYQQEGRQEDARQLLDQGIENTSNSTLQELRSRL